MKPAEASAILQALESHRSAGQRMDTQQRDAWLADLLELDYPPAKAAATRCKDELEWLPSWAQFVGRYDEEKIRLRQVSKALDRYECRDCLAGRGWVVIEDGLIPTVRPCGSCRPEAYELWSGGHLMPNHVCGGCVKRGRR